ncbi:glycosyl hydrolase [Zunongwangia sp. F363]|uniref:Glycosyl hydrolase n=1 Tax=Autumnicola tepida TaxID=3075595 RepID=A0ABU3C6P4_9FLAO|nr:glycosyl hydrolase [Zunongwangia sp. F363]MDT0642022.1 glycosyl hydrolase [Zunongwangia sp. F363]
MKRLLFPLFLFFTIVLSSAQQPASSGAEIKAAIEHKSRLSNTSTVKNLPLKNIGPTIMSGRVVDFAVNPENPTEFYVAYATGGLWYTNNNGNSFIPVTNNAPTQNIGDVAVDWKNGSIWLGTGEVNASRSSYAGVGILKSEDKGENWQFMGLPDSHHISRILINPEDPEEIVVGVTGHLYSSNQERGVFKTTDGGKTWNKTLFINDHTGIIDVASSPKNYNIMYAAAWDKDRKAWNFRGSGEGSAIYKSEDAGETWTLLSDKDSGFPTGEGVGRIGLSVFNDNTLYAIVDNQNHRPAEEEKDKEEGLTKADFENMSTTKFLNIKNEDLEAFLRKNNFQEKYSAESVKEMIKAGEAVPQDLALYLKDANSDLFETPVIGAQVYKSEDGGKSWQKTHEDYLDDLYYSYGYYFGMIHVDPQNEDAIYIYGVPILKSKDGGKTFTSIDADNVHADHHALWINPNKSGHLIDGNDGGVNITYDDGEHWMIRNSPAVGQFYSVNVDHAQPYNIYGGLQDNGVWVGAHTSEETTDWQVSGNYPFKKLLGGDGMQVEIDSRNPNLVYTGFQFGNYFRINQETDERDYIQPRHNLGEKPYRFNWQAPILLSPHNQDILYMGSNKLLRSMNQGDDWTVISADLTAGGKEGNVPYGTLSTISESPFRFGLLYTGSDDGVVQVTKNGGGSWSNITAGLPKDLWVSRIIASEHKKERVYVTLNGYRWDDFTPYIFISEDYGETWENIAGNLPLAPINVIREDPENENILYLGTDDGAYISFNRGQEWEPFSNGFVNVPVHDLRIQENQNHLIVATHGRSLYLADITPISEMNKEKISKKLWISPVADIQFSSRWGNSYSKWLDPYTPETEFTFYSASSGNAEISIKTEEGFVLKSFEVEAEKGFNEVNYDLSISEERINRFNKSLEEKLTASEDEKFYLPKGKYTVEIKVNGDSAEKSFSIK